jgi:heme oxygenase (biliverdin-IX-beta and delta-forming)
MQSSHSLLLSSLRSATSEIHQRLHVHPLLQPLAEGRMTLKNYQNAITAFFTCYSVMEEQLDLQTISFFSAPVLTWLKQDMVQQNISPHRISKSTYPPIDTLSKYVGYLYVKQGSTLGGRVISKRLEQCLMLRSEVDQHFFAGYGDQTGMKWKDFLLYLEEIRVTLNEGEVITQAVSSFEFIEKVCSDVYSSI